MEASIRLLGILVASWVALAASVLGQFLLFGGADWSFVAYSVLTASIAGALIAPRVRDGLRHGIGEVLAMATATYLIAILLFPIVTAIVTSPSVTNGGEVHCVYYGLTTCQSGLHGAAAQTALDQATLDYYVEAPVAIALTLPVLVGLLIPATAWVVLMRRFINAEPSDEYFRSL